jgi:hypothetical protein
VQVEDKGEFHIDFLAETFDEFIRSLISKEAIQVKDKRVELSMIDNTPFSQELTEILSNADPD